ncbi:MAG: hypothetical protein KBD14_00615 [Candidatus Pacebacteria bacterium]|jgi:hypothetical protein|nr:hypothetical protein [Candidatus Paceibacterota bacterium]
MENNDPFNKKPIKPQNPFDKPSQKPNDDYKKLKDSIENFSGTPRKNLGINLENFEPEDQDVLIKLIEVLKDRYTDQEVIDHIFELTNCSESAIQVFKLLNGVNGESIHTEEEIAEIIYNEKTDKKGISISRVKQLRDQVERAIWRKEILEYIKTLY